MEAQDYLCDLWTRCSGDAAVGKLVKYASFAFYSLTVNTKLITYITLLRTLFDSPITGVTYLEKDSHLWIQVAVETLTDC